MSEHDAEIRLARATGAGLVAEKLRWHIATLSGLCTYQSGFHWFWALVVWALVFWLVNYQHQKEYDAASDNYEKITRTGKYYVPKVPS